MKIKHHEIEVVTDAPFTNCKLNREPYAKVLTEIVNSYADGFVLAINNEWGTGKTTFVKMWRQQLNNEGFQTIYFNAWENDFNDNPLVALMSELKPLTKGIINGEKVFKSVVEKGAVLTKNVAPAIARSLIKKYIVDAIENTTKAAAEILEEEIKEYSDKKKTITEFRTELEKFVKKKGGNKPLIFIIDELDRCRPNYAVEVLEQLKHFFSVNGIVFVLSIDKKHLASSVRGFYGSEKINTEEYLRRFIDLEYSIPRPSNKLFLKYLFDYYELDKFFYSKERIQYGELQSDATDLLDVAELLFNKTNPTLRQQEKIFGQTRLILNSFKPNQYTFSHLLFVLIYIKTLQIELYQKIENNALTIQELSDSFVSVMPLEIKNDYGRNLLYVVALLLHFYNNNQEHQNRIQLLESGTDGNIATPIKIKLADNDSKKLAGLFKEIKQRSNYTDGSLKYLICRINLTESVIIN
ncbi:KAP family P-loop NTPase fold protein [Ohtaekwangia koreensis]|uniref:KAP family P-loop domain-containing protein n=1 Tax=Ohtaekwangia koreensis TaxID=688867 RepID=A0A1T5JKT0_9BACT|nr:P-loop NTPase fold protein [Ohtaekwangia koreensis]SKC51743.1 KAP family P-loop domain-containing protein [Ohtaekwangia koreensis]